MSATTLYVRDARLWKRARDLAGSQGLSSLVERALGQYLDQQEPLTNRGNQRFALPVEAAGDAEVAQKIEFTGRLAVDSRALSVEQLPRIRVYRTVRGRLVVYRTWPTCFGMAPSFSAYQDFESLLSDPLAVATTWITDEDKLGERTDLTAQLVSALREAVVPNSVLAIDDLQASDMTTGLQAVRMPKDADSIRRALGGRADQDVLLVAMHLLSATADDSKHLSEIEKAFAAIKPMSRLGNTPDTLKDIQAAMRGYLNNDTRKRSPAQRLFINPKRGFWGLSKIGEMRARDVLHQAGMARG